MKKFLSERSRFFREPVAKFLLLGLVLYLSWIALYEWGIHPAGKLDNAIISNTIYLSTGILEKLGYVVEHNSARTMGIKGTPGLFIGDSCNGISLFALYSIFLLAFPGKIVSKIIFIPAGIIIIHLLNVLRVVCLSLIEIHSYEWTEFNHTYTFTILIYIFIFVTWLVWINKFSGIIEKRNDTKNTK